MTDQYRTAPRVSEKAGELLSAFRLSLVVSAGEYGWERQVNSCRALLAYIAELEADRSEKETLMKQKPALLAYTAKLEAENAHLMHASEEVMAENVRLQQRVEELEKAARPPLVPKIDPDLGW